ncbi:hypothetical protein LOAG_06341 [Loa loa]|uniref:Uncharacterized protein n=1 Tax=Loa loa TaxID=7209 RepID=A0A1S0TY62_LOALO|nr:hypothetical protein LOAG_06341 [Loa loa]EFO22143.1 hypothetical protein LOAG_06341 [Loa loa]
MMQLVKMISNSMNRATIEDDGNATIDNEKEEEDEFVDATDVLFEDESDMYDDNVQFIVAGNSDYFSDDDVIFELDDELHELGLMLNSTLASDYDGANAARLNAHFFNDWTILLEKQAIKLGFPDLEELLKSEYMKEYVEQTSLVNGVAIYGAVSKPANEHILRRVADCRLNEDQRAKKRKMQRLMELKNPENSRNFLEGKRRILEILLDLKAYKTEIDYQTIRDEYMKRYSTSLNAAEHQRLFMNKSALKNFWRVFYREIILINDCPIRVRLRNPNIQIPEEITDDLHLLANIDKIELPTFALECRPSASNVVDKGRAVEYPGVVAVLNGSTSKKPTMSLLEEVKEDYDRLLNSEKQREDIKNADRINSVMLYDGGKAIGMPADKSKVISVQEDGSDKTNRRSELLDLSDDKYTGDEESTDSSDFEVKVSRKYQKKKFKGNINTFNISSTSPEVKPSMQTTYVDGAGGRSSHSRKDPNPVEQVARLMDSVGNKISQSERRPSIAERSLHQSLSHSHPKELNRFPLSATGFNNKSSAGLIQMHSSSQSVFNREHSEEYNGIRTSGRHGFQFDREEEVK